MNKKRYILIFITIILLLLILFFILFKNDYEIPNEKNNTITNKNYEISKIENIIISEENISSEILDDDKINLSNEVENIEVNSDKDILNENNEFSSMSSLPNDTGLTVNGIPKSYNQDLMACANIAYLLGCNNIEINFDFENYIEKNMIKNGVFISDITGYQKTNNPYDYIKSRKDIIRDMLLELNFKYDVGNDNYLIANNGLTNLEIKLNKIISSDKKIIIAFVPEYYVYINDSNNEIQLGGGFNDKSYISLKPYKNIYTFIFDSNSNNIDDFYEMLEEISNI